MKKINRPDIEQKDLCNSYNELQYREIIEEKSENYHKYFKELSVLLDFEIEFISQDKNYKNEQKKMYSERLSNKSYTEIYKFYKQIKMASKICPFCNYPTRTVSQVDHFFPKAIFPSLAITVDNLVPICRDCNNTQNKGDYYSTDEGKILIHPYFDDFVDRASEFIECKIIEDEKIGFIFKIKKLDEWDDVIYSRVKIHFEKLKLHELYNITFEGDFDTTLGELRIIKNEENKDVALLKSFIKRRVQSLSQINKTPWLISGYKALLASDWFFDSYI